LDRGAPMHGYDDRTSGWQEMSDSSPPVPRTSPWRYRSRRAVGVPGGGILIRDVAGDLYHIVDPDKLDAKSRTYLWASPDW